MSQNETTTKISKKKEKKNDNDDDKEKKKKRENFKYVPCIYSIPFRMNQPDMAVCTNALLL